VCHAAQRRICARCAPQRPPAGRTARVRALLCRFVAPWSAARAASVLRTRAHATLPLRVGRALTRARLLRRRRRQSELFDGLNCQAGAMVSRKQLSDDLSTLLSCAHTHALTTHAHTHLLLR
jgi:hypothetical protein